MLMCTPETPSNKPGIVISKEIDAKERNTHVKEIGKVR